MKLVYTPDHEIPGHAKALEDFFDQCWEDMKEFSKIESDLIWDIALHEQREREGKTMATQPSKGRGKGKGSGKGKKKGTRY